MNKPETIQTEKFHIRELDCAGEVPQIRKSLDDFAGIESLSFVILESQVIVNYFPELTDPQKIRKQLRSTGWTANIFVEKQQPAEHSFFQKHFRLILTMICGFFMAAGFVSGIILTGHTSPLHVEPGSSQQTIPLLSRIFYALSIGTGGFPVLIQALKNIRQFRADMNVLMAVAVTGAIILNEWLEAAMVTFLFALSLTLESWSTSQAKKAISGLVSHIPDEVLFRSQSETNTDWTKTSVKDVKVGDQILCQPGNKIPLDGIVLNGESLVDQAPITGESVPVHKKNADEVYAGTLNTTGSLEIQVTKESDDSMLAQIQKMVLEAQADQAPVEQFVELFARIYTPIMLLISLLIATIPPLLLAGEWSEWFYRSLVILVIACPCALVISTPVSIVSALSAAARSGILIKGGRFLEQAATIQTIAFDKTGTVTYGKPVIDKIVPLNQYSENQLLEIAASIESHSPHPFSRSIIHYAEDKNISYKEADQYQYETGLGGKGVVGEEAFWVGGLRMLKKELPENQEQLEKISSWEEEGYSTVVIGNQNHLVGCILFRDSLRENAREMIQSVKDCGIKKTVLLTGDNELTARRIAEEAGIETVFAELLPDEKQERIQQLKQETGPVMMVGDGINDAPAMAVSSLSLSMGKGTDVAIETSDVTLMNENLMNIPRFIRLSGRTIKIIQQNITFALGLKILFLILTVVGFATMWLAILADTGASLIVIANGLRLLNRLT